MPSEDSSQHQPVRARPAPSGQALVALAKGCSAGCRLRFGFVYGGILFAGETDREGEKTWLGLRGDLGPIPYSLECGHRRRALLRILHDDAGTGLARFGLAANQHILIEGRMERPSPPDPVWITACASRFVMDAKPRLDLLADYLRPGGLN